MRNEWRVDRTEGECPCGMNSIRYLGESEREARRVYSELIIGFDAWDQPSDAYGVGLFRWSPNLCEYVRVAFKDIDVKSGQLTQYSIPTSVPNR